MIDSFIRYVKFEKRYSDHTITAYENDLIQLEAFAKEELDKDIIQDLTFKDVRSWIFFLSENDYSNKSINRKIATIKSYYKFLLSREEISSNPTERIQPLKTEKKLPVFLKENEITDLLDKVNFDEKSDFETYLSKANKNVFSSSIGLLKALLGHTAAYNEPLYSLKFWGNFFLMWILVWVQTGFAMVIFSAALRGVPEDTIEAAKIDGANPFQMFFRIKLPQIYSTVVVVWTTLVILVLKMFDIPYALSANDDDKLLLATMMENARNNWSVGGDNVENLFAAIAVMLMVTVIPNMIYNARRIRREQKELGH